MESLPPNKRFRLTHQQEHQSNLPAKKRKPSSPHPPAYSLPAKKRVWALPPDFDLNAVYHHNDDDAKPPLLPHHDGDEEDDGISCAICQSTDGDPADPIVFCDGCDLMVHASCYGAPLVHAVPDGDWFCARCSSGEAAVSCCLCPNPGGAVKPAAGRWAHVVCAVLVPEVYFEEAEAREGINWSRVPSSRWERRCYVCERDGGCVVDCSEPKCGLAFHVTCGLKEDLCFEYMRGKTKSDVVASFCKSHTDIWKKQEATGKFKIVARQD